ncbi:hypothetical protein Nepgr_018034 [Nepenthes gracilis]|uniref:DUF4408 domain-containing protein n=1 Tax=Nepenthes gracilis TaxID=150966 RepID=A0AAD3SRK4_NEPGR|nr:hypothetical protein Nepgr_018034 [Nepenthes gracilis]
MSRPQRFRKIANVLKTVEAWFFVLMLLSWSVSRSKNYFPAAVELSGVCFRRISVVLFTPHFAFIVGNVIILTLLIKSRQFSSHRNTAVGYIVSDFDYLNETQQQIPARDEWLAEAVFDDKRIVLTEMAVTNSAIRRTCRRTPSDEFKTEKVEKAHLRRSETEPRGKIESADGEPYDADVDGLSNDEFQRRVEAFIEKRQRFLKEESIPSLLFREDGFDIQRCNAPAATQI